MDTTLRLSRSIVSRRSLACSHHQVTPKYYNYYYYYFFCPSKSSQSKNGSKSGKTMRILATKRNTVQRKEKKKKKEQRKKSMKSAKTLHKIFVFSVLSFGCTDQMEYTPCALYICRGDFCKSSASTFTVVYILRSLSYHFDFSTLFTLLSDRLASHFPCHINLFSSGIQRTIRNTSDVFVFGKFMNYLYESIRIKTHKNLGHNSYCTSTGGVRSSACNLSSIHEFILHKFVARGRERQRSILIVIAM